MEKKKTFEKFAAVNHCYSNWVIHGWNHQTFVEYPTTTWKFQWMFDEFWTVDKAETQANITFHSIIHSFWIKKMIMKLSEYSKNSPETLSIELINWTLSLNSSISIRLQMFSIPYFASNLVPQFVFCKCCSSMWCMNNVMQARTPHRQ